MEYGVKYFFFFSFRVLFKKITKKIFLRFRFLQKKLNYEENF